MSEQEQSRIDEAAERIAMELGDYLDQVLERHHTEEIPSVISQSILIDMMSSSIGSLISHMPPEVRQETIEEVMTQIIETVDEQSPIIDLDLGANVQYYGEA